MSDAAPLVFVDCETTGLDPARHEVYEVALIRCDDDGHTKNDRYFWLEPSQLHLADARALQVGRYYQRRDDIYSTRDERRFLSEQDRYTAAIEIASFTEGCHLIGANPSFDAGFITAFLRRNGAAPAWHHRLIDIESLAIGLIVEIAAAGSIGRPRSLSDICEALDILRPDAHTARADCVQTKTAYFKLMEMAEQRDQLWCHENG